MSWRAGFSLLADRWRIVGVHALLLLVVEVVAAVLVTTAVRHEAARSALMRLSAGEHLVADWRTRADARGFDALADSLRQVAGLRMAFARRQADGSWQVDGLPLPATRVEELQSWLAASAAPAAASASTWVAAGSDWRIRAVEAPAPGPSAGLRLLLVASVADDAAELAWLQAALAGLGVSLLVVFALMGLYTARWVARPLAQLSDSARRLGAGDFDGPIQVDGPREIQALAEAFEAMREAVRQRERQIRDMASIDSLTALPNRAQFRSELKREIERSRLEGQPCAVLVLDLDRFKRVNDVLGPRYGDRLLREVAERLRGALGSSDLLARLGGDEFAVLCPKHDESGALAAAARIKQALKAPGQIGEHTVDLSATVGVAVCPQHGEESDRLIGRAEQAMLSSKRTAGGVGMYHVDLEAGLDSDLGLLTELRRAVDVNQLRIVLQPKVNLASGQLVGAEALVRWMHPERGELLPASFIPFAEQTGVISEITRWMLQRGLMICRRMVKRGMSFRLSVNLSTRDLLNADLALEVADLIEKVKVKPDWLVFEITESVLMEDPERARHTLDLLHHLGVRLSIDDFGTGYSSLGYLKRLPVHELKIDRSFVMNMDRDRHDAKIVRSTIDLAHNLSLKVVAEGLESARHWELLRALNCDEAQGYYISAPLYEDDFLAWADTWVPPVSSEANLPTLYADIF